MSKISESFDFGDDKNTTKEELFTALDRMYRQLAVSINKKPDVYFRNVDGQTTDTVLSNGDININTSTLKVEVLTEHTSTSAVVWTTIS